MVLFAVRIKPFLILSNVLTAKAEGKKICVEDFSQLDGKYSKDKYNASMEGVACLVDKFCSFPDVEKLGLFRRVLFCFLTGNEDMHLKNFSLVTDEVKGSRVVRLSPVYDFVNSTIVIKNPEEIALPIGGRKKNLTKKLLTEYYGKQKLKVPEKLIAQTLRALQMALPKWQELIQRSFLSENLKTKYGKGLKGRAERLEILKGLGRGFLATLGS